MLYSLFGIHQDPLTRVGFLIGLLGQNVEWLTEDEMIPLKQVAIDDQINNTAKVTAILDSVRETGALRGIQEAVTLERLLRSNGF